jgi:hypothetical protein
MILKKDKNLGDQSRRAAGSVVMNLMEGALIHFDVSGILETSKCHRRKRAFSV